MFISIYRRIIVVTPFKLIYFLQNCAPHARFTLTASHAQPEALLFRDSIWRFKLIH